MLLVELCCFQVQCCVQRLDECCTKQAMWIVTYCTCLIPSVPLDKTGNVDCHLLHVFDSISAVEQNSGNVDCHLLHVLDSISAVEQNSGNVDCHLLYVFDTVSAVGQNSRNGKTEKT